MSKALADLMERKLFDVFGEVNPARHAEISLQPGKRQCRRGPAICCF
jgi:hypothetical protein